MTLHIKQFKQLTSCELYDILKLRAEVFVVEQECVYNDLDNLDKEGTHIFAEKEGSIVAYARMLKPGTRFSDYSIGRLVVAQSERGTGLGVKTMEAAKDFIIEEWEATQIKISAQKYLQQFYEELGFCVVTNEYLEDGIPHLGMLYKQK